MKRTNGRPIQPTRRGQIVIEARPIMEERKRQAALRSKRGLIEEWERVMNAIDHDLRGWAESLKREIGDFLVRRASSPQTAWSF